MLTISGYATYDISAPETLRLRVPGSALASGVPTMASGPQIILTAERGAATLSGTLLDSPFEKTMQSVEGGQLFFTLSGDGFVDTLGQAVSQDDACTGALIDQLTLRSGRSSHSVGRMSCRRP